MNHFTLSVIALSFTSGFLAQPVLQSSDVNATIGESFLTYNSNAVNPGASGDNVTWDLSSMTTGSTVTTVYSAANASFSGSNITATYGGSTMAYLNLSSAGVVYHGMNTGGTVITYQNPMIMTTFPLSNNASNTDYFHATFTNGVLFERFGTISMEVDGYGTLITPEGTFTDVLRVHYIQDYKDSNQFMEIPYYTSIYAWYKAGVHNELASVSSITYQGTTNTYAGYLETNGLGILENEQQLRALWPNPATEQISMTIDANTPVGKIEVTDLNGHVFETGYQVNGNEVNLDLSNLNDGIYFVKVVYSSGLVQQGRFVRRF